MFVEKRQNLLWKELLKEDIQKLTKLTKNE